MAISSRRPRRPGIDIWPGFVDALSQLVMVIVFVLLVFTAGQFYLTDALSGRDAALQKLTQQINQLADMLSMARNSNTDLQTQLMQLTRQLQAANQQRDQTSQALRHRATARRAAADPASGLRTEGQRGADHDRPC